jgi:hypothetical protein
MFLNVLKCFRVLNVCFQSILVPMLTISEQFDTETKGPATL